MRTSSLLSCLSLALLGARTQADVLVVAPAPAPGVDHLQIVDAVAAANEGDLILVRSGLYDDFTILGKSLDVVAEVGASVTVQGGFGVRGLDPAQAVLVRGLNTQPDGAHGCELKNNQGAVWIEECTLRGALNNQPPFTFPLELWAGALVENCARVSFQRCVFTGGDGSDGSPPNPAGSGLQLLDSDASVYACSAQGGVGGDEGDLTNYAGGNGGHGIYALGDSVLFVSGSNAFGGGGGQGGNDYDIFVGEQCEPGGTGGDGVRLDEWCFGCPPSGLTVRALDSLFGGGPGGPPHPFCAGWMGTPGQSVQVWQGSYSTLPGDAVGAQAPAALREGESGELGLSGPAGSVALVLLGVQQDGTLLLPFSGLLLAGAPSQVLPAGSLDASGEGQLGLALGALGAGVEHARVLLQAVAIELPSGAIRLGGASALTLLDAAF